MPPHEESHSSRSPRNYVLFLLTIAVLTSWTFSTSKNLIDSMPPVDLNDIAVSVLDSLGDAEDIVVGLWRSDSETTEENGNDFRDVMQNENHHRVPKATIAYATTVTKCDKIMSHTLVDGAAVLAHSIYLSSIRRTNDSKYDFALYAFIHPDAAECSDEMERIGYTVQIRETPVNISHITNNTDYQETVQKIGCCGDKEFLKLYSYLLTDYPVVVHLDIDTLILKPFDELFDAMLLPESEIKYVPHGMWDKNVSHPINSFFTRDYPMVHPGRKPERVGMQGGFWLIRPNPKIFQEYCNIILSGNFRPGLGWGVAPDYWGGFWGSSQIQGIVIYYFGALHPNTSLELNRCYYNNMADIPVTEEGRCLTGEAKCQDCRDVNVSDLYSVHYTFCQKPWSCANAQTRFLNSVWKDDKGRDMCMKIHQEWHRVRYDLELRLGTNGNFSQPQFNDINNVPDYYYGHCKVPRNALDKVSYGYVYEALQLPEAMKHL